MPHHSAYRRVDGSYAFDKGPNGGGYGCTRCGEDFTTEPAFVKHFASSPSELTVCYAPSEFAELGLEERDNGRWGYPLTEAEQERLRALPASGVSQNA